MSLFWKLLSLIRVIAFVKIIYIKIKLDFLMENKGNKPLDHEYNPLTGKLNVNVLVEIYRQRAIIAIQIAFLIGSTVVLVLVSNYWTLPPILYFVFVGSIASLWLAIRKKTEFSAIILGTQFLILPTYLSLHGLGTFDSVVLLFPAGMMILSIIAKPIQTAIYSFLTLIAVGIVGYQTYFDMIGNNNVHRLLVNNPVDIYSTLTITGFAGILSTYMSMILTTVLHKLADYQANLENKIEKRTRELAKSNDELRLAVQNLDQARVELVRGEKLAGLGSLVAGVSHELNTPIGNTAISASTLIDIIADYKKQFNAGNIRKTELANFLNRCSEGAELILNSTQRASDLVSSFKQVAVDQTSDRRRCFKVGEVINDVLRTMRPSFKGHEWTIDYDVEDDIECDGFPGPLGQVLTNLVQNAVFHGFSDSQSGHIHISAKRLGSDKVQITVSDNGKGIAAESLEKIYDPFFTTRLGQGGSGLGLTIVHNLVTVLLSGRIDVKSTVGVGTTFTMSFPLKAPPRIGELNRDLIDLY